MNNTFFAPFLPYMSNTVVPKHIENNACFIGKILECKQRAFNNYSSSPNGPSASWAIDSEAMRARGIIILVKSN